VTRRTGSLAGAALAIAVVTVVARAAGFGRTLVFARTVGFGCLGSTYQTANTVPNIVFEVVAGGALASLVVPLIAGAVSRGDQEAASRTTSALLTWTLTLLIPAAVLVAVLARPIVSLLIGTPPDGCDRTAVLDVGTRMLQVFAPQVPLYGIGLVLAGVAQAHRRFLGPAVAPLLSSAVVIAAYFSYAAAGRAGNLKGLDRDQELVLSIGTTAGVVVLALSLLLPLRHTGLRLRPRWTFGAGVAAQARALAVAGVSTLVAQQLAVAVGLRLANDRGPVGAVALFALASTVFLLPWAVLAVPLATSAFPRAAAAHSDGDAPEWQRVTGVTARAVLMVSAAAAAVLVAAAQPLSRVVALGAPGRADVRALALAIAVLAPGLLGYGLVAHLGRALAARGEARAAAVATCAGWLTVVVADLVLVPAVGQRWVIVALAAGNSAGMSVAGVLLARQARPGVVGLGRQAVIAAGLGLLAVAVTWPLAQASGHRGVGASLLQAVVWGGVATVLFALGAAVIDRRGLAELRSGLHG
jgi:putative peptidoglycan lipid II flippase